MMNENMKEKAIILVKTLELQQKLTEILPSLSYQTEVVSSITEDIIEKIRSVPYRVIILEDGFQNTGFTENRVYQEILSLPMSLRRNLFFILCGRQIKHLDQMESFAMSANLVVNTEKIREMDFEKILRHELARQTHFYQVFMGVKAQINQGASPII